MKHKTTGFLIEYRLHGYAKNYAKDLTFNISRKFHVKGATSRKVVPHITLYGPATTHDIRRVVSTVQSIGQKYTLVPFTIKGLGSFTNPSKVIYLDIAPSTELKSLRWELSEALQQISTSQTFDKTKEFGFHSTIAFKDIDKKFKQIQDYIKQEEPNIKQYVLRITIIGHKRRILYEYDLILKKLLNRNEALSRKWWGKTFKELNMLQGLPVKSPQSLLSRLGNSIQRLWSRIVK
jgi:2'-5' RNA ligase